jgi:hypothetical protein
VSVHTQPDLDDKKLKAMLMENDKEIQGLKSEKDNEVEALNNQLETCRYPHKEASVKTQRHIDGKTLKAMLIMKEKEIDRLETEKETEVDTEKSVGGLGRTRPHAGVECNKQQTTKSVSSSQRGVVRSRECPVDEDDSVIVNCCNKLYDDPINSIIIS